jgi:hypothetical protein
MLTPYVGTAINSIDILGVSSAPTTSGRYERVVVYLIRRSYRFDELRVVLHSRLRSGRGAKVPMSSLGSGVKPGAQQQQQPPSCMLIDVCAWGCVCVRVCVYNGRSPRAGSAGMSFDEFSKLAR